MHSLDVGHAKSVVVIKRSMGHGYAGIDIELHNYPRPACTSLTPSRYSAQIMCAIKTLVG